MRTFLQNIAVSVLALCFCLVLLEVALFFLPVTGISQQRNLTETATPLDVAAAKNSTLTFSKGWNFINVKVRKTNNMGFFSDFDYEVGKEVMVAIGDSYTEAAAVNFKETYHQRLSRKIGKPIYNIALSGSPLSQYEAYLQAICTTFRPTKVIIAIVSNDFDESFFEHRRGDGFFHYRAGENNKLTLTPTKWNWLKNIVAKSNLVRYMYFHLGIGGKVRNFRQSRIKKQHNESNKSKDKLEIKQKAIDVFLSNIGNYCLNPKDIILVVDGDRAHMYGARDKADLALAYFAKEATARGFATVDMHGVFAKELEESGKKANSIYDYHWNALGHELSAQELARVLRPS